MNIKTLLRLQFPDGTTGGQCGNFAHKVIEFAPVGDSYSQKKKAVQANGILNGVGPGTVDGDFRAGDVIITSEGTWMGLGNGHVAINMVDGPQPMVIESNFKKDGKIRSGRLVPLNKIYGVIRGPYKFKIPQVKYPIVLKTTIFMQYRTQWNKKCFTDLEDWFFKASGGRIKLELAPLYTYDALKNWWYRAYSVTGEDFFNLIALEYFNEYAMPLRFPDSKIILWSVNKQQWQGSVFFKPELQEIGWYYPNTNPLRAIFCCEEEDKSPINLGMQLFVDAARHEIMHGLYRYGRWDRKDLCHERFFGINGYPKDFNKVFDDLDYNLLNLNLINN